MARRSSTAALPAADPIFQAIAAHKAALAYWLALPDDAAHAAMKSDACGRETYAVCAVFRVTPTTTAGASALLAWLVEPEFGEEECNSRPRILVINDLLGDEVSAAAIQQLRAIATLLKQAAGEG